MTSTWLDDDYSFDDNGYTGEADDLDDDLLGEDPDYGEATVVRDRRTTSRSPARQASARRVAARHQLAALRRQQNVTVRDRRQPARVTDAVRRTQATVQEVDLRGRVQTDEQRSALRAQSRRTEGTERALGAKIVEERLRSAFGTHPLLNNAFAQVVVPLTPLLFLRPPRGPLWQDTRVLATAAVVGITVGKELLGGRGDISSVELQVSPATQSGDIVVVKAVARDSRGRLIPDVEPTITPVSNITQDPAGPGAYKLGAQNTVAVLTASAGGKSTTYVINIK